MLIYFMADEIFLNGWILLDHMFSVVEGEDLIFGHGAFAMQFYMETADISL